MSPQRHRLGLYYLLFYDNIAQEEVCVFLRELLRHLRGPVIVLLDNSSTYQGAPPEAPTTVSTSLHREQGKDRDEREAAIFSLAAERKLKVPDQNIQVMLPAGIAALFLGALKAAKFQVGLPPCHQRRRSQ